MVEFKSVSRSFTRGDFKKLLGYAAQYHAKHDQRIPHATQLSMVMVLPKISPSLRDDAFHLGFTLNELDPGYFQVRGPIPYQSLVVALSLVAVAERDALLRWFADRTIEDQQTRRWLSEHTFGAKEIDVSELEGYEEIVQQLMATPKARQIAIKMLTPEDLAKLPAEARLEGLEISERLKGLSKDDLERLVQILKDKLH